MRIRPQNGVKGSPLPKNMSDFANYKYNLYKDDPLLLAIFQQNTEAVKTHLPDLVVGGDIQSKPKEQAEYLCKRETVVFHVAVVFGSIEICSLVIEALKRPSGGLTVDYVHQGSNFIERAICHSYASRTKYYNKHEDMSIVIKACDRDIDIKLKDEQRNHDLLLACELARLGALKEQLRC